MPGPQLLQDWIAGQAQTRPEATAIVAHDGRLDYGELEAASNRLARALRAAGCRRGDRVALLARKSPAAIVALLGIYKAAAIYVPLDPESSAGNLIGILDASQCHWMITSGVRQALVDVLSQRRDGCRSLVVGSLDREPLVLGRSQAVFTLDDVAGLSSAPIGAANGSDDPAHILFSPGSTGTPRGVVITHASVIRFVEWATRYFGLTAGDRVSAHSPLHFHLSFFDVFGAAAAGAEIHLPPPDPGLPPVALAEFVRGHALTQWCSVPSVLGDVAKADAVGVDDFPHLRRVIWGGEVFPIPTLMHWMGRLPHVSFTNLYGPIETTIASSYYTVPACPVDPHALIPIGTACDGEELLVLGDRLEATPPGEAGDLYIGGAGLARGYWGDPDRTAAAFTHHPLRPSEWIYRTGDLATVGNDGLVRFLGRRDPTIKGRGERVELEAIEAAVNALPDVAEGAVVALAAAEGAGVEICCAYVPAAGTFASPAVRRAALSRRMPSEMIPRHWLRLPGFPINANGKIDRHRLKDAFAARLVPDVAHSA